MNRHGLMAVTLTILLVCSNLVLSQSGRTLTVLVHGLKNSQGEIIIGLHKEEAGFPGTPYLNVTGKIKDNKSTVMLKNLPAGEYAIALFHDENTNGKLDHDFLGIRHLEGFGVSNNKIPLFLPPRYRHARFSLRTANKTITIDIEY